MFKVAPVLLVLFAALPARADAPKAFISLRDRAEPVQSAVDQRLGSLRSEPRGQRRQRSDIGEEARDDPMLRSVWARCARR